nr:MAG TPA: hypothetical protein [Caudoviricetes sp.]
MLINNAMIVINCFIFLLFNLFIVLLILRLLTRD